MLNTAKYWIEKLKLEKHPEGGWFKEIYRSADVVDTRNGIRNASTSIYYLLEGSDYSALHRIQSDEIWHYYAGNSAIEILWIENQQIKTALLGSKPECEEKMQLVVPKKCWFAARLTHPEGFALAGCTVSPGFDFKDFELADDNTINQYPKLKPKLQAFIRAGQ